MGFEDEKDYEDAMFGLSDNNEIEWDYYCHCCEQKDKYENLLFKLVDNVLSDCESTEPK